MCRAVVGERVLDNGAAATHDVVQPGKGGEMDEAEKPGAPVARRRIILGTAAGVAGGMAVVARMASASASPEGTGAAQRDDDAAIRQLTVDYARATDAIGRADKAAGLALYLRTFTDDAEIMVAGSPDSRRVGAAAWADYVDGVFRSSRYDRTQHLVGTIDVRLPGQGSPPGRATMSTYLHATHHVADGSALSIVLGTYEDEVVQAQGSWRIARRVLHVLTTWRTVPG
jgi:hypothetical protein